MSISNTGAVCPGQQASCTYRLCLQGQLCVAAAALCWKQPKEPRVSLWCRPEIHEAEHRPSAFSTTDPIG